MKKSSSFAITVPIFLLGFALAIAVPLQEALAYSLSDADEDSGEETLQGGTYQMGGAPAASALAGESPASTDESSGGGGNGGGGGRRNAAERGAHLAARSPVHPSVDPGAVAVGESNIPAPQRSSRRIFDTVDFFPESFLHASATRGGAGQPENLEASALGRFEAIGIPSFFILADSVHAQVGAANILASLEEIRSLLLEDRVAIRRLVLMQMVSVFCLAWLFVVFHRGAKRSPTRSPARRPPS